MNMNTRQKEDKSEHLKILNDDEIASIYNRPYLTCEERYLYFTLSQSEKDLLQLLRSVKSQVYFVLQLGYFRAKHLFFNFEFKDVVEDLQYVLSKHFNNIQLDDLSPLNRHTCTKQQRIILQLTKYRKCSVNERERLKSKARITVTVCSKPVYIFRELMNYLDIHRIVAPGYRFLQDTVRKALTYEQNRLVLIMQSHLEQSHINTLNKLLEDSTGLYVITQIKHEPKDFSIGEIKREIQRGKQIQPLYFFAQELLPKLKVSNESIKYYASLVEYYSVYRLKRLDEWTVYIYLLCFIYHRYQQVNDNLINTFIYNIRHYIDAAKKHAKEQVYKYYVENYLDLEKAGQVLKLFIDENIEACTPFQEVQEKAFAILEREKFECVAEQIATDARVDGVAFQWEHIDKLAPRFKLHLRPILLMVEFSAPLTNEPLIEALDFMKQAFLKGNPLSRYPSDAFPKGFLIDGVKRYLYEQKTLLINRYEFLVYRLLRNSLESGDTFCRESIRFRSFEDDLIDDQQWQQKEKLIADSGLTSLFQPIKEHLSVLEQQLEKRTVEVNQRITSGENKYFKIKKAGTHIRWTLKYARDAEYTNHPFFDALKPVELGSILHFVNQQCHFFDAFEHVLGRYKKKDRNNRVLAACITAWGTNMGLGRMGECSDIPYSALAAESDDFIRPENLKEANDIVCNDIFKLPVFHYYDIDGVIHSSSDGQKFETRIHTINSRHSPKYFGLGKGIVPCTFVINHVPANAKNLGANDHESHSVFDILYNNTTDIQPDIHSTDTHGTNEVNFAILHLFGYQFAPRYRDIYKKVTTSLYGFNHPGCYDESFIIKPIRKINIDLIIEEWENIERIMLSLALKTTTQSIIIRKLSSHARINKTKRALWEYDNIIKSLYLLDYIDSVQLRRNVQRALNRGESYHKLHRALSYANFGKLRFKTEQEQHIWGECGRLLANCIIHYNTSILSNLMECKEKNSDVQGAALLQGVSPVAWTHINLGGRFEFKKDEEPINMDSLIQELAQMQVLGEAEQDD
jgi:TnpA family transposase